MKQEAGRFLMEAFSIMAEYHLMCSACSNTARRNDSEIDKLISNNPSNCIDLSERKKQKTNNFVINSPDDSQRR